MLILSLLDYFPEKISKDIAKYFEEDGNVKDKQIEEIRLRANKPMILKFNKYEKVFKQIISQEEILKTIEHICENSIYSYQNEICNGYITVKGGHRVGITGNTVIEKDKVVNINHISSLNFRIAKQIIGCSNKILKYVLDIENNNVFNTLIVSPPGAGKTTLIRDLVRIISTGIETMNFDGINVGLVDERGEIAAMYKGIPQNDVGIRTDVLDNVPKSIGMNMLIRSMTPKVIVADEIGSEKEIQAINYAVCSGIKGIFTAHSSNIEEIYLNPALKILLNLHIVERVIFITDKGNKGEIEKVYMLNNKNLEYINMEGVS